MGRMKRRANRVVRDDRPECPTCAARFDVKPGTRIRCGECGETFTAQRKTHRWESGIGRFIDRVKVGGFRAVKDSSKRAAHNPDKDVLPERYASECGAVVIAVGKSRSEGASRSRTDIDVSADWGDESGDTILLVGSKECRIVYLRGGNCFRRAFLNACLQAQCEPISLDGEIISEAGINPDTGKWESAKRDVETGTQYLIAVRRDPELPPDAENPALAIVLNATATARSGAPPQSAIVHCHKQLSVRVPGSGTGQGPDKIRPAPPSAFGKKETVSATKAALLRDADTRKMAEAKREGAEQRNKLREMTQFFLTGK